MSMPAVTFRPCTPDDLPLLAGSLAQPHVARWWRQDPGLVAVNAKYLPRLDGRDPTELFVLEAAVRRPGSSSATWSLITGSGRRRCAAPDSRTWKPPPVSTT